MDERTPGPWKRGTVEHNPCGYTVEIEGGKPPETIATVECYEGDESNLNLILAILDLLAACEEFMEKWNRQGLQGFQLEKFDGTARRMEAAIAKAKPE